MSISDFEALTSCSCFCENSGEQGTDCKMGPPVTHAEAVSWHSLSVPTPQTMNHLVCICVSCLHHCEKLPPRGGLHGLLLYVQRIPNAKAMMESDANVMLLKPAGTASC